MWNRSRPHDRREHLFGGRGAVRVWNLSDTAPRAPFGAILACELEPGSTVGTHTQVDFAEILIVIEGAGLATVAGAPIPIHAGSLVQLPLGETLALENKSADLPLRYLIIKAK